MTKDVGNIWNTELTRQLAEATTSITDVSSMQNFLRDVMTEKEIIEISGRLEAARMLSDGAKYKDITEQTKLSSRTVARISDWLRNGCNGYPVALTIITSHHSHSPPARAT